MEQVEIHAYLSTCAAAVAVEDLAHQWHRKLKTPAVAFMGLALCVARRLVVGSDAVIDVDEEDSETSHGSDGGGHAQGCAASVAQAVVFLTLAPVNVSQLVIMGSVTPNGQWDSVVAVLAGNRCHGFLRRLDLPEGLAIDDRDVVALLDATRGLAHLRSLTVSGAGVNTLLNAVGGTLRWLALPDCSATQHIHFAQMPLLRCVGAVRCLPATVTSIDLWQLKHLVRIGDNFGSCCSGLRDLRLPPTVTAIGFCFLNDCTSFSAVLDLSHLTQLEKISDNFANRSTLPDVRLPPSVTTVGDYFLFDCTSFAAVLDLSHLTKLASIGDRFAFCCAVPDVRLPPSLASIGSNFLVGCSALTAVLDLSHLAQLEKIRGCFACRSTLPGVRLPPSATAIGFCFLDGCMSFSAVLDLSHLTLLEGINASFASNSSVPEVLLPPGIKFIGDHFLLNCGSVAAVLDLSQLTQLESIGRRFTVNSSVPGVRLPPGATSVGDFQD
jgi:hypothetical protein